MKTKIASLALLLVTVCAAASAGDRDATTGIRQDDRTSSRDAVEAPRHLKETPCEQAQRKYRESLDCFAPFVIKGGGVRPEAFQRCQEMKEPPQCSGSDKSF